MSVLALFAACSSSSNGAGPAPTNDGGTEASTSSDAATGVSIEGDVFQYLTEVEGPRIQGAKVSVVEHPEMTFTTTDDAHFRFDGLTPGESVTLVVEQSGIATTQTNTVTVGPKGIMPFSIQVVPNSLYAALAALLPEPPALDSTCAVATTVARMGGMLFTHQRQGLPGVTVKLDPPVDASSGPFYFTEAVLPSQTQTATSIDGGALFYRVPPGKYTLSASLNGAVFNTVAIDCRVGMVVNAGPPMGILANVKNPDYAGGVGRADDDYSAASDAFCEETAQCVNTSDAGVTNAYPAATLADCKAQYRNTWSYVDDACDATAKIRDAAKTFFACRASSCANALGDDSVCADEDTAFRAAETAYGACVSSK
ncbi:MAG TPA: carboxypeptidase-like regulatory domain-containing protein [Polyangiaceae bacterium]